MNDEFPPTKSGDEGDGDEASQEANEKQEDDHQGGAITQSALSTTPPAFLHTSETMNHAPQMMMVPIQPYYPPYPIMPSSDAVYIDQSLNLDPPADRRNRGGVTEPFPEKLHR